MTDLTLATEGAAGTAASGSTACLQAGAAYPLGAHWNGDGVNFALTAPNAHAVELCLFNEHGDKELTRMALPACTDGVWHGYLDGGAPGLIYGYRVAGDYAPHDGHRFNPNKVLLDPYARAIVGEYRGEDAFHGDNPIDTAAIALKARVVHEDYDWGADRAPRVPPADTILYELHVKGFTKLHPQVPEALRGTYAGLAHTAALDHLQALGISTVSLLPVHHRADEARLQRNGLSNYWGYSSIGFFAPESRYWSGRAGSSPISEFRDMIKALHQRGIEVVLDVVYNHTGETDASGPTLSFRGIDNALYYCLRSDDRAQYENWSGCGNCLNLSEPRVLQLVMDSLSYWVQEMHVDGFRFDLAPILGRGANGFSSTAAFFAALRQDPVLTQVKLIAEPWDIGDNGYQLGNFPAGWLEWNDQYRDTMRALWMHQWPSLGEVAQRFAASSQQFRKAGRLPAASVNFITAHDGYTLHDLVSYNHKRNQANLEDNRDGHHHNHSWNCGVEGATDDAEIVRLRARIKRALLATLLLSQGTPMLLAGDEIGHSQQGNNNAYCQDNETNWLNWQQADQELCTYVASVIALRQRFAALRNNHWLDEAKTGPDHSDAQSGASGFSVVWYAPDGNPMSVSQWECKTCYRLGIRLEQRSDRQVCLVLINAEARPAGFVLPAGSWSMVLDSASGAISSQNVCGEISLPAHAVLLLELKEATADAGTKRQSAPTQRENWHQQWTNNE